MTEVSSGAGTVSVFSPAGTVLVLSPAGTDSVSPAEGAEVVSPEEGAVVSPAAGTVLVSSPAGTVLVLSPAGRVSVSPAGRVSVFSPAGTVLVVLSPAGTVSVLSPAGAVSVVLTGGESLSLASRGSGGGLSRRRSRGGQIASRDGLSVLTSGNGLGVATVRDRLGLASRGSRGSLLTRGDGVRGRRLRRLRLVTVEVDLGNLNLTLVLGLVGLLRVDEVNLLGTTTLGVVDIGTVLGTVSLVLTGGAVGHIVVELETAVELGLHVELVERELLLLAASTASERGGLLTARATLSEDGLAKGSASEITLRLVGSAGPALEIPVVVLVKLTDLEVVPLPALLLVLLTLVVDSLGRSVLGSILPVTPVSGDLAKAGSKGQKGKVGLHGDRFGVVISSCMYVANVVYAKQKLENGVKGNE
ncbi:hypothetical protein DER45DRAFT_272280 [Fusarium avenaceum]|nr:hypothetical protein DER45DRAFT_272280 [Fusarium avenaceum]